jgi:hypothetical protein
MSDQFPPSGEPTPPPGEPVPPTPPADATPPPPPPPPPAAGAVPPPPAAGYAPASHAAGNPAADAWSVGNAFSYGWAKFQQYLAPILTAMIALFVIGAILYIVAFAIYFGLMNAVSSPLTATLDPTTGAISTTGGGPGLIVSLLISAVFGLIAFTVSGFIQGAVTRAGLAITEGRPIETSTILSTERLGPIIITAVLYSVFTAIGLVFCYVGAIVVQFFLLFSFFFLLDKGLAPFDAIKASVAFVREHIGDVLLLFIVSLVAYAIGYALCGIGLIVAYPVVLIATAYTYKKFTDQPVAA